jgi:vacuolar-type H+-ATPase subunit I/STV1
MSLVVEDVAQAQDKVTRLAVDFQGYIVSSWLSGEEQDRMGYIAIRIPDDKLEQVMSELRLLAVRVASERTNSQDVTEEYIDLKSRLSNAEATESQYLALLEKAINVDEILKIYDSLSRIRQEIEQLKGRIQYLERTSSMALVSVQLSPAATDKPLVRAGWSALEVLKSAVRGIVTFGQWLGTLIIWLLIFIPVWGTILGIILWRRRKKKKTQ